MATMAQTHSQSRMPAVQNAGAGKALVNVSQPATAAADGLEAVAADFPESHPAWELLAGLPILLDVSVPVRKFCVRDLLALEKGAVVQSSRVASADVPLCCDGVQLCWTEFETVGQRIAVRLTMLG
jgi:flagellar motor switch protein FliN/FliY